MLKEAFCSDLYGAENLRGGQSPCIPYDVVF